MKAGVGALPDDVEALKAALMVARAEAAAARAQQSDDQALIAHLKLQIEKLNRDRFGPRSERTARLLDQLELTLEELVSSATEDELAAEMAAAKTTRVASFTRKRPSRKPFPDHLPRERVIIPGPTACACCGGARLSKRALATPIWNGQLANSGRLEDIAKFIICIVAGVIYKAPSRLGIGIADGTDY